MIRSDFQGQPGENDGYFAAHPDLHIDAAHCLGARRALRGRRGGGLCSMKPNPAVTYQDTKMRLDWLGSG
jgi:hypothetical protein